MSEDADTIIGSVEVERENEAWQRAEPSLSALARRSGRRLAITLALWSISCTASDADVVVEHLELPLPHLQMLQLFSVSIQRDFGGNKLLLLRERAFLLPMFLWKHSQGKRKDKTGGKSTRAGTGCSAWLCHGPATNVPLGLREMAATELAAAFQALLHSLPSSSLHELQPCLRPQA